MDKEASTIASAVTAFLIAAFGALATFGLDISEAQRTAILATVAPTVVVVLLLGQVIRQYVYSQHTVEQIKDVASGKDVPPPVAS